ncbi:MAG: hypothetical protein ACTHUY_06760 [Flaviflexus sp.]
MNRTFASGVYCGTVKKVFVLGGAFIAVIACSPIRAGFDLLP